MSRHRSSEMATLIIQAWRDDDRETGTTQWRFRLQNVDRGEPQGFATVEALTTFLEAYFSAQPDEPEASSE